MYLTRENIKEIVQALLLYSVKDTEFKEIKDYLSGEEYVTLILNNLNVKISTKNLQKYLMPFIERNPSKFYIEDTLYSTSRTNALSANMGRELHNLYMLKSEELVDIIKTIGFHSVNTILDLDNLKREGLVQEGCLVYIKDIQEYRLYLNNSWELANLGGVLKIKRNDSMDKIEKASPGDIIYREGSDILIYKKEDGSFATLSGTGIPILNQTELNSLSSTIPKHYISVPDYSDLQGNVVKNTYTTSGNGNYVDILFSAIRQLQAEVTKLKNSFTMGIVSYSENETSTETIDDAEEPLWAMDEEMLTPLENIKIGEQNSITPITNVQDNIEGRLIINGTGTYNYVSTGENEDLKLYLYTTINRKDIIITFKKLSIETAKLYINFNNYHVPYTDVYNIAVIISREKNTQGSNFIYVIISDKSKVLKEGYFNPTTLELLDTKVEVDGRYYFNSISFADLTLYKCNTYSKDFDFTDSVVPIAPTDEDYKYKASHITIRSASTLAVANSIIKQLLNNELVFIENELALYIKNNNQLVSLAINRSETSSNTGMTEQELITKLRSIGIVSGTNDNLEISKLGSLTFILTDTNKQFKFTVNNSGELVGLEVSDSTLALDIITYRITTDNNLDNIRGLISRILIAKNNTPSNPIDDKKDVKLFSDRLKIGSIYAPFNTDKVFGCSHSFIELENTSNTDINLKGMYIYLSIMKGDTPNVISLSLTGIIKAGSTYLIRGKQHTTFDSANCFIKVTDFDLEWYNNGELVDLSIDPNQGAALMLVYGDTNNIRYNTSPYTANTDSNTKKVFPYKYAGYFVDSFVFGKLSDNVGTQIESGGSKLTTYYWAPAIFTTKSNSVIKNTFELDPAKQAFQAFNTADSSRARWASANDVQVLSLAKEYIEFPKTNLKFKVSNYTPRASKYNKNVCTDKTLLNKEKPNMVTCSFGIDMLTTRTFNWISSGLFDEYVWIIKGNYLNTTSIDSSTLLTAARFESYKSGTENDFIGLSGMSKKTFTNATIKDAIYNRITSTFPGSNETFTSHKCIVKIVNTTVTEKTIYSYIVGRADKNGMPDMEHCSSVQTFTLYPSTVTPKIFQTTDQQGFHWIEYQVWTAAAEKLNSEIDKAITAGNMPILMNTGDMTQNGTRINEWLDYYEAGKNLFNHLEQVNCVGNNDLCGTIPTLLGTGDDDGKSNSYYFHLFYCYEIDETNAPIYKGTDNVTRYIPSLYYLEFNGTNKYLLSVVNSELTPVTCELWYKATNSSDKVINIYTGYTLSDNASGCSYESSVGNTYIYELLYKLYNTHTAYKTIVACHEMPFTVITNDALLPAVKSSTRSLNGTSLLGSHLNQLSSQDFKGTYWFSRLLEHFGIKLCIGGHKHTYSCTFPVKENWTGTMNASLQEDTFDCQATTANGINITKKPLVKCTSISDDTSNVVFPGIATPSLTDGVTYFMCQATGYKLTSNKELPSANQIFSKLIPKTTVNDGKDTASAELKHPMYAVIDFSNFEVKLIRLTNIMNSGKFDLYTYGTNSIVLQYATAITENIYGSWTDIDTALIAANTL